MRILEELGLKDIVTYKQATLSLNTHPITVIRGRNEDAGGNPNGAGKTLLFGAFANLVTFNPPTAASKNSAKDFHREGSEIYLRLRDENHSWKFSQLGRKSGVGYKLLQDDRDLQIREVASAKSKIEEIFSLTPEQFYSLVYLNGLRPNPFIYGKGTERHSLFESLFDLGFYDDIYHDLRPLLNAARQANHTYATLKRELKPVEGPIPDKAEIESLRNKANALTERLETLQQRHHHVKTFLHLAEDLVDSTLDEAALTGQRNRLTSRVTELEEEVKEARALERAWESYNAYNTQAKKLKTAIDRLGPVPSFDEEAYDKTNVDFSAVNKQVLSLNNAQDSIARYKTNHARLTKMWEASAKHREFLGDKFTVGFAEACKEIPNHRAYIKQRQDFLGERLRGLKESKGSCLVCGGPLDDEGHQRLTTVTEREIAILSKVSEIYPDLEKTTILGAKIEPFLSVDAGALRKQADALQEHLDQLRLARETVQHHRTLTKQQRDLTPVERPSHEPKTSCEELERKIGGLRAKVLEVEKQLYIFRQIEKLPVKFASTEEATTLRSTLEGKITDFRERLKKIQDLLRSKEDTLLRYDEQVRQQAKLEALAEEQKKVARRLPVYDALTAAYGPRGLRIDDVRDTAQQYVDNLNEYAGNIFAEPFSFSVEIKNREFSLIAHRAKGESDIRYLSGFEARAFALLSIMAILPLLPSRLRCNCVILDEMEANLSKQSRDMFGQELIPQLSKVIPNVFVVTPFSSEEFYIPGARQIVVVRENGVSRLETL